MGKRVITHVANVEWRKNHLNEQDYPRRYPFWFKVVVGTIRFLASILIRRLTVEGLENIPKEGRLIIVLNHIHYFDSPVLGMLVPREMWCMVADKYKHHPFGLIVDTTGAIYIQRGEVDRKALKQSIAVLEADKSLAIAIEGTRSKTGGLAEGKTGVAYLATRTNSPVLPVALSGTEEILSSLLHFRRADVIVRFGEPIVLPSGEQRARSKELEQYTEQIMVALAKLLPDDYRGVYREHPAVQGEAPGTAS